MKIKLKKKEAYKSRRHIPRGPRPPGSKLPQTSFRTAKGDQ